jgi:hypothetical protein
MTWLEGIAFEFVTRVDSVGLRRLYPKVRATLLDCGYQLTETVAVMRVLERLVATTIERDAKRLQVQVCVAVDHTEVRVLDRRRLNGRQTLPSEIVPKEYARSSGCTASPTGGITFWAIVDRVSDLDQPRDD